ncbi:acyltransferase [Siccirubricoccus deserti]|uniref:Acyl-CoA synthetase n=1 Tax=Siccirubricoccus deserti TaxID=2013562 RepID=A0A9X0R427_9PROT|nr:acyl-CoA synthetase [Siccirubricoccus deserti]MBC4018458.1 acyl-CoA synthetase [Siccirubricoccus deserti]GGC66029.1 acyltransferase [Siccirubricoccus deserti]
MAGAALNPPAWRQMPERGNTFWLRFMIGVGRGLGWHAGHALLYPITAYFLAFSPRQRQAARQYLGRALGRPARFADLWRLYFTFAATILDRVWLAAGRTAGFEITVHGLEALRRRVEPGPGEPRTGCLLFGAHLGSFEALRAVGDAGCPVDIAVLMHEANAARVKAVFDALGGTGRATTVIPLGCPDSMLRVREVLEHGGLVGLLADRAPAGQRMHRVKFLGSPAPLPTGPHLLAAVLGAPVMLAFGIRTGPRRYTVHFLPFAERIGDSDRAGREAAIIASVERYARELEAMCRAHPYNWFNFYPFWQDAAT